MLRYGSPTDCELALHPLIAERAAEIRRGWSEAEHRRRRLCCLPIGEAVALPEPLEVPTASERSLFGR